MKQVIAHIDMDCFYAAVEEKYNPKLKGKSLVIGGLPTQKRGVVSTANYEARRFGIKSAMPIKKAFELNKDATFIKPNIKLYKSESKKVMEILKPFSNNFEQVSIDEAYLDITEFSKINESLELTARAIKKEVYKKTRLTCSIGISSSKFVSKIASDFNKPVGTTVVRNHIEFLKNLNVNKIPGIGKVTHQKMLKLNIKTIDDLAKADKFLLLDNFGKNIIKYQEIAKGNDETKVNENTKSVSKSISCEKTFEDDISLEKCKCEISRLSKKVHQSLKKNGYKTISIKVRFQDFKTITKDKSLKVTHNDIDEIISTTSELLDYISKDSKIRLFGIKLSNICENITKQQELLNYLK